MLNARSDLKMQFEEHVYLDINTFRPLGPCFDLVYLSPCKPGLGNPSHVGPV